jgi:hypothetical protein
MSLINETIDLGNMFDGIKEGEAVLEGLIGYYGMHYIAILYDHKNKQWNLFDDAKVTNIGSTISSLRSKVIKWKLQPVALFFSVNEKSVKKEVKTDYDVFKESYKMQNSFIASKLIQKTITTKKSIIDEIFKDDKFIYTDSESEIENENEKDYNDDYLKNIEKNKENKENDKYFEKKENDNNFEKKDFNDKYFEKKDFNDNYKNKENDKYFEKKENKENDKYFEKKEENNKYFEKEENDEYFEKKDNNINEKEKKEIYQNQSINYFKSKKELISENYGVIVRGCKPITRTIVNEEDHSKSMCLLEIDENSEKNVIITIYLNKFNNLAKNDEVRVYFCSSLNDEPIYYKKISVLNNNFQSDIYIHQRQENETKFAIGFEFISINNNDY